MARVKPRANVIRKVFRLVQGVDPHWRPNTPSFQAGMVLVGACFFGTDERAIAEGLKLPEAFVRRVAARCRKQRIWRADRIRTAWEQGDVAFVCDALVASGQSERPPDPKVSAQNAARAKKRSASGLCSNCGRERDDERRVCGRCREAVKASQQRRKMRPVAPVVMATCDPLYQIAAEPSQQDRDLEL